VQIFFDCLLYFTSFGAIFTLFASVVSILVWLLKTLFSWATAEPESELDRLQQFRPQNLDFLKRAGQ